MRSLRNIIRNPSSSSSRLRLNLQLHSRPYHSLRNKCRSISHFRLQMYPLAADNLRQGRDTSQLEVGLKAMRRISVGSATSTTFRRTQAPMTGNTDLATDRSKHRGVEDGMVRVVVSPREVQVLLVLLLLIPLPMQRVGTRTCQCHLAQGSLRLIQMTHWQL